MQKVYEAYIECTRNLRYCYSLFKPTDFQVSHGIGKAPYFEDGVVELVAKWKRSYDLYTDYPVKMPVDDEVTASISTRPPTPAHKSSMFPQIVEKTQKDSHKEKEKHMPNGDILVNYRETKKINQGR